MNNHSTSPAQWIFLYGPPGSGKTTLGKQLAKQLKIPFYELDLEVEAQTGRAIPAIFSEDGEEGFRIFEKKALVSILSRPPGILALGGGSLLDENNLKLVTRHGNILFLKTEIQTLLARIQPTPESRPLLMGDLENNLRQLISHRDLHYSKFTIYLDNTHLSVTESVWEAQILLGRFLVRGMDAGYPVIIGPGVKNHLGLWANQVHLGNPATLVADSNVAKLYGDETQAVLGQSGFQISMACFPAGEKYKNLYTIQALWEKFYEATLERRSTVFALGGGITSDLAGFAAATYLRGISWCAVPTSLLSMVDASLGGKTGIDLSQGKNLVGSFYAPRLIVSDPQTLSTLPDSELRNGLAEVVKAGIIGDPTLFKMCEDGWESAMNNLNQIVSRAAAVKIRIIEQDPLEKDRRVYLNLGHTLGHAIEKASEYSIPHGYAVSIGIVAACHIAEELKIAPRHLEEQVTSVLIKLGLPVQMPENINRNAVIQAMQSDKKKRDGVLHIVLPSKIGKVRSGIPVVDYSLWHRVFDCMTK